MITDETPSPTSKPELPALAPAVRRVHPAYWVVSLTLAAALLYWSLRGIEWARVAAILSTARLPYVALAMALTSIAMFLRAVRWRVLLTARKRVSVSTAFWATAAGYFGNNFLPARAGEIVRTMMVSSRSALGRTFVFTTAMAERMVDAVALVIISAAVLAVLPEKPVWLIKAMRVFGVVGAVGIIGIIAIPKLERLWKYSLERTPMPDVVRSRVSYLLDQVLLGIRSFHDVGRVAGFVALTIVIWFIDATFTVVGGRALGLAIDLRVAFLLIAGLGLGSALPSTPGYVGIYQFVAVTVLVPFGLSRTDAIAYILFAQALMYVVVSLWGVTALTRFRRPDAKG
ncbi:MAG TPA: lysylphosphatidylglycerol synthase transmembrane domain-containing protein [Bryobacteraceae bacterium]|nr:lysylphosphatidylglycerol synthase transmembrane domain-containing protein [Bryobacteraceae bacterium]